MKRHPCQIEAAEHIQHGLSSVHNFPQDECQHDLGASHHGENWHKPDELTRVATKPGLVKQLIPAGDQESFESRKRGLGVVLSAHRNETILVETEAELLTLRLEKGRKRFEGEAPHVRYRFMIVDQTPLPHDDN